MHIGRGLLLIKKILQVTGLVLCKYLRFNPVSTGSSGGSTYQLRHDLVDYLACTQIKELNRAIYQKIPHQGPDEMINGNMFLFQYFTITIIVF